MPIDIPNACTTSANQALGTTSLEALSCNLGFTDNFANTTALTVTNRVGLAQDSVAGIQAKAIAAVRSAVINPVGVFGTASTIVNPNDAMLQTGVGYWYYTGTLPHSVSSGDTPVAPAWTPVTVSELQSLLGLTDPSDLAQRHRIKTTVAEIATGVFNDGDLLEVSDRANAPFEMVTGGTADGFGILNAGPGKAAVTDSRNIEHLGAVEGGNIAPHLSYLHSKDKGADVFLSTATIASTADFSNKNIIFKPKGLSPFGKTVLTVTGNFPAFKWATTGFPSGGSISGCYIDYGDEAPTDEPTQGQRLAIDYGDADIGPATWGAGHKLSDMYIRGAWIGCKDRTGAFLIEWERVIWQKCRKPFIKENGTTLKLSSCYAFECPQGFTAKNFITLSMINHAADSGDSSLSDFGFINLISGVQNFYLQLHAEINDLWLSSHRLLYIENSTGCYSLAGLNNYIRAADTALVEAATGSSVTCLNVDEFKLVQSLAATPVVMTHLIATGTAKAYVLTGRGSLPTVGVGAAAPQWYHSIGNVTFGSAFNRAVGTFGEFDRALSKSISQSATLGTFGIPAQQWSLLTNIVLAGAALTDSVQVSVSPAATGVIFHGVVESAGSVNVYAMPIGTSGGSIAGQTVTISVIDNA
jgi:hypothetical protein